MKRTYDFFTVDVL